MKNVFTLTKTLTLSLLLIVFAGASAASIKSDGDKDTSKCGRRCCKDKESAKEMEQATKIFNDAIRELVVQVRSIDAVKLKSQTTQSFTVLPVKMIKTTNGFVFAFAPDNNTRAEAKQKIDFNNIDKEMDTVQENMSQMDPCLKKDDAKNRRAAEEILKTGIKS